MGEALTENKSQNFNIEKWLRELKRVEHDVVYLKFNNTDFNLLAKRFNECKLEPYLWEFAKRNYVTYMSMCIRRLVDDHKDAVSLWKLLNDIESNAQVFTKKWFLEQWPGGETESLFKVFFGESLSLQPTVILSDKQKLISETKIVTDRADKFEAHTDKSPNLKQLPTFNDIDNSVNAITLLFCRYYYLLKQVSMSI